MIIKEMPDSVIPKHIQDHFTRICKEHGAFHFKDKRWLVQMMLDFAERTYIDAMLHGCKHGYEAALKDITEELDRIKEKKT